MIPPYALGEELLHDEGGMDTSLFFSRLREGAFDAEAAGFIVGSVPIYDGQEKRIFPVVVANGLGAGHGVSESRILAESIQILKDPMIGPIVPEHCVSWDSQTDKVIPESKDGFTATVALDWSVNRAYTFICGRNFVCVVNFSAGDPGKFPLRDSDFVVEISRGGVLSYPRMTPDEELLSKCFDIGDDRAGNESP